MRRTHVAGVIAVLVAATLQAAPSQAPKPKGTSLSIRVSPQIVFSPARVVATAELKDVDDASGEFYCPALEWEWGDGTTSEATFDCEPFEAGRSEIKKRYVSEHTYQTAGRYRLQLRLKRQQKTILASSTSVQVRPGVRDGFGY